MAPEYSLVRPEEKSSKGRTYLDGLSCGIHSVGGDTEVEVPPYQMSRSLGGNLGI